MIKTKKQMFIAIGSFLLVILLGTTTYAFFNYTRTGTINTIKTGRIAFNSTQGQTINLTNMFPIDVTGGIPNDATKVGTVTINVTGDTTYGEGIEYLVSAVNVQNEVNSRIDLPISIDVSVASNDDNSPITTLGTLNDNYFNVRGSTTSYYKILAKDTITSNDQLVVGYIAPGADGVDGNIVIRAYLDASKIAISDTYPSSDPTYIVNNNMTQEELSLCASYVMTEWQYSSDMDDGTTGETFCNGTGTNYHETFQENLDHNYFTSQDLEYFKNHNIIVYNQNYSNGTTDEWVGNRVVLTTSEWNSLQSSGISFQVKVEANEGTWVEPLTLYKQITDNVNTSASINFATTSISNNDQGLYVLSGTENNTNPIYYYRGGVTDNNVVFAGYCWQIVRTTDTGGVKMVYNGTVTGTSENPTCENNSHANRILSSTNAFNSNNDSMSDVGYMSNTRYSYASGTTTGLIFGKNIEWDGTNYLIIEDTSGEASTNTTKDNDHHYSCETSGMTSCSTVRYYYYNNYFITLTGGDTIEDAIYKMTGNGSQATKTKNAGYNLNVNDSTIKGIIDTWFRTNLTNELDNTKTDYSVYLEDTIYCNDRSFKTVTGNTNYSTYEVSGWNPSGGDLTQYVYFGTFNRWNNNNWYSTSNVPSITCPNETDRFTVSSAVGNGALTYPIGLLTADEMIMAGASGNGTDNNSNYYLHTGGYSWTMSPYYYTYGSANGFALNSNGIFDGYSVYNYLGIRPAISLKHETEFVEDGEGTKSNPYVVKYNE